MWPYFTAAMYATFYVVIMLPEQIYTDVYGTKIYVFINTPLAIFSPSHVT